MTIALATNTDAYDVDLQYFADQYAENDWARTFVETFTRWIGQTSLLDNPEVDLTSSQEQKLQRVLQGPLPQEFRQAVLDRVHGNHSCQHDMAGFLMGCALARAAMDRQDGGVPATITLQRAWWAHGGLELELTEGLRLNGRTSPAFGVATALARWLHHTPGHSLLDTQERTHFARQCKKWEESGLLADIWDTRLWARHSRTAFEASLLGSLLAAQPDCVLPLLKDIPIPPIMKDIFYSPSIRHNPAVLLRLLELCPECTETDENDAGAAADQRLKPSWNRSIIAPCLLEVILHHATMMNEKGITRHNDNFLHESANILLKRSDGLYLALHYVEELHNVIEFERENDNPAMHFLEALVLAVEKQCKGELHEQRVNAWLVDFLNSEQLRADLKSFQETGILQKQVEKNILRGLAAKARLLSFECMRGSCGHYLLQGYQRAFCRLDEGFYTSEHSMHLPNITQEAIAQLYAVAEPVPPAQQWQDSIAMLASASNRTFRNSFSNQYLEVQYVYNYHLGLGLALADTVHAFHGVDQAQAVLQAVFDCTAGRLRVENGTMNNFYVKTARLCVCRLYLFLMKAQRPADASASVVALLHTTEDIPMLNYQCMTILTANGLAREAIRDDPALREIARSAYAQAKEHGEHDHWNPRRSAWSKNVLRR